MLESNHKMCTCIVRKLEQLKLHVEFKFLYTWFKEYVLQRPPLSSFLNIKYKVIVV